MKKKLSFDEVFTKERLERMAGLSQVSPWERTPALLKQYSPKDDGASLFNRIQRAGNGLQGFIVCFWQRGAENPALFWDERLAGWESFTGEGPHYPRIYVTLSRAMAFIRRLRIATRQEKIGLAWWKSDQAHFKPLKELYGLKRSPFPGCPRGLSRG